MKTNMYEHWLHHPHLMPELKEQLLTLDEAAVQDSFYTNVTFGTAGMRGLLGPGTNRMNIHTIRKANLAFARYIMENGSEAMARGVAIAYDNRHYSKEFAIASAEILASCNIKAYVFTTLRPTPVLSFAVRHLQCFGGIMITASHNPKEYNGYKVYDAHGCQLIPSLIDRVIAQADAIQDALDIVVNLTPAQRELIVMIDKEVDEPYITAVKQIQLRPEVNKENLHIIFTPQHGTALVPVERVFQETGYHYTLVKEQASPDPDFSNTLTPNPEEAKAYELGIAYAKKYQADLVVATDPDADRLGIVVRHKDSYHLMSGNQTGAVLINYVMSQLHATGKMPAHPVLFNTVVTGDLGEAVARKYRVDVEKTLTGFKFIGEKILQYEATQEKQFVFGYEESYGYLLAPFVRDKDAIQACLMIAECAAYYQQHGKTLLDVLYELYEQFGWYLESQTSLTLQGEEGARVIARITDDLREKKPSHIADIEITAWEDYERLERMHQGVLTTLDFPSSNVLKFFLSDGSWIAVRPSGTEPKCKFYFCVKGSSEQEVQDKTARYQEALHILTK